MDFEIGDYRRERRRKPWAIILILIIIALASVSLWKPAITGFTSADGLISIPIEAPEEETISTEEELISIPIESVQEPATSSEPEDELIQEAEDELVGISATRDFYPSKIEYSPLGPSTDTNVTISATIKYENFDTCWEFNTSLYIDGVYQTKSYLSACYAEMVVNLSWIATSAIHDIKIVVDSDGEVSEADETNNNLTSMIGVDWPMFGQTTEHYGISNGSSILTNDTIWSFTIDSGASDYGYLLTVAYDKVYVGSDGGKLYALNAYTGDSLWNYTTGGAVYSAPAVYNDKIYVGSYDNIFYVLNATNGTHIWNYTTLDDIDSSAAIANDVVFIGTYYIAYDHLGSPMPGLLALNATNGTHIWNATTSNIITYSSPAIYNDKVYVGDDNGFIYALNQTNGTQIWNYSIGDDIRTSPTVANDIVYVGSYNDNLTALNATNGSFIWNYTTGDNIEIISPNIYNNKVYVGSDDDIFYVLNATNGTHIWNFTTGGNIETLTVIMGDVVFFGSGDSTLYALNATNGTNIWNYTDGGLGGPYGLAAADNKLYVTDYNGYVYCFGTADTILPSINYTSPTPDNDSEITVMSTTINVTVTDDNSIEACILGWKYQGAASFVNYTMTKVGTGTSVSCNYTNSSLTDGLNYTFRVYANDSYGNWNESLTRTFKAADITPPSSIEFVNPTPGNDTRRTSNSESINVTVIDSISNIDTCLLEWNGVNETMTKISTGTSVSCNITKTTSGGTNYTYKVHANESGGNWNNSITRMFRENAKPNITSVSILPATPYNGNGLNCSVSGGIDADDDTVSYYYKWYNDGVLNLTVQNTTTTTNNISHGNTSVGDSWKCAVIPHDGLENGTLISTTVTVIEVTTSTSIPGGSESGRAPSGGVSVERVEPDAICGNAICENGENQTTCCIDCGCANGFECIDNECVGKEKESFLKIVYNLPGIHMPWLLLLLIMLLICLGVGMIHHVTHEKEPEPPYWYRLTPLTIPKVTRKPRYRSAPRKFKTLKYKPVVYRSKLIKPKPRPRKKVSKKQFYKSLKSLNKKLGGKI